MWITIDILLIFFNKTLFLNVLNVEKVINNKKINLHKKYF